MKLNFRSRTAALCVALALYSPIKVYCAIPGFCATLFQRQPIETNAISSLDLVALRDGSLKQTEVPAFLQRLMEGSVFENAVGAILHISAEQAEPQRDQMAFLEKYKKSASYPWQKSWLPNESVKLAAYHDCFIGEKGRNGSVETTTAYLQSAKIGISERETENINKAITETFSSSVQLNELTASLYKHLQVSGQQKEISNVMGLAHRILATMPFALSSTGKAQRGLVRIQEIMSQHLGETLPEVAREVLLNSAYQEGIRRAALRVMDRVNSGGIPSGNFFDDIFDSFRDSGHGVESATEATWNVIAVVSRGGPNTVSRFLDGKYGSPDSNRLAKTGLSIIAGALPLLDWRSRGTGHLYSYPPEVTSHLDTVKPYHFWMTAFLARQLHAELQDPFAAAAAAYTAEVGYQFLSRSGHRSPELTLTLSPFSSAPNISRADLVYAAAGAKFGAFTGLQKNIRFDIDAGFTVGLRSAVPAAPLSIEDSNALFSHYLPLAYWQWMRRFAPVSIFRYFFPISEGHF